MIRFYAKFFTIILFSQLLVACSQPYRVGDHVLVEWGEDKLLYPAFIIEVRAKSRFRVHYEGYPSRWEETVDLPRITGRVVGEVAPPPPPLKVRVAQGLKPKRNGERGPVSQFKVDDRLKVRWGGSIYRARVIKVVSSGQLLVHYEGHEDAWDEVIELSRIVDK